MKHFTKKIAIIMCIILTCILVNIEYLPVHAQSCFVCEGTGYICEDNTGDPEDDIWCRVSEDNVFGDEDYECENHGDVYTIRACPVCNGGKRHYHSESKSYEKVTCDHYGYDVAWWKCSCSAAFYTDTNEKIPKDDLSELIENFHDTGLGHDWSNHDGVCARSDCKYKCGHKGLTTGECTICGADLSTMHFHEKKTHHEAVPATCVASGNIEYWDCTCGKTIDNNLKEISNITIEVDSSNHNWGNWKNGTRSCTRIGCDEEDVCAHNGATIDICEICGLELSHNWGNWNNGIRSCTNEDCSAIDEHIKHEGGTASCIEKATCSICGAEYGDFGTHSFTTYSSNEDATYVKDGTKTAKCDYCSELDTVLDEGSKLTYPDGWFKVDNNWLYGNDGNFVTGWKQIKEKWYYFNENTGAMTTGWKQIGTKWYYFNTSSGVMTTGWKQIGTKWYYFNANSGAMTTGWKQLGEKWYYFNASSGAMITGWKQLGEKWYYFNATSGAMTSGWKQIGEKWYYFDAGSGVMTTGWKQIGTKWYYFNKSTGIMVSGTQVISGKTYKFNSNGTWIK